MTKLTKRVCAQWSIHPVWSESSLSTWRNTGSLATHWAHSEDSDQTGRMPRLTWALAGHTLILLVLSCRGSLKLFYQTVMSKRCILNHPEGAMGSGSTLFACLIGAWIEQGQNTACHHCGLSFNPRCPYVAGVVVTRPRSVVFPGFSHFLQHTRTQNTNIRPSTTRL